MIGIPMGIVVGIGALNWAIFDRIFRKRPRQETLYVEEAAGRGWDLDEAEPSGSFGLQRYPSDSPKRVKTVTRNLSKPQQNEVNLKYGFCTVACMFSLTFVTLFGLTKLGPVSASIDAVTKHGNNSITVSAAGLVAVFLVVFLSGMWGVRFIHRLLSNK